MKGNATLFDGSVVETSQASADLRLNKGVEITMSPASRGTLYSDHLVLQQGPSQVDETTGTAKMFNLASKVLFLVIDRPALILILLISHGLSGNAVPAIPPHVCGCSHHSASVCISDVFAMAVK